jgi:thiol-disulfide isomerase/thioredoxin
MNKSFFALLIVLLPLLAKAQETVEMSVSGTAPADVKVVLMQRHGARSIMDSIVVTNGKWSYNGAIDRNTFMQLRTETDQGGQAVYMIADGTPVTADMNDGTVTGSIQTVRYNEICRQLDDLDDEAYRLYDKYQPKATASDSEMRQAMKQLESAMDGIRQRGDSIILEAIWKNQDNMIPAAFIAQMCHDMDYETLKAVIDPTKDYYHHIAMDQPKRVLAGLEKRHPGLSFTNLTMNDPSGSPRSLSEWCGRGNYVLIDFWASWCGPCRHEMPNVVAAYKRYHAKGFGVVGVSLDNNLENWKRAIVDVGMEWPNISDLKGWKSLAASTYGLMAIPANILLDGQGTIIAIDLRGEALASKLREIYGY